MIDKILKFLPIGTLIIIICGFIKLFLYYSLFYLDITPYLTISDLFNLFLTDTISISITLSGLIFNLIKEYKLDLVNEEEKIRQDERSKVYKIVINDLKKIGEKTFPEYDNSRKKLKNVPKIKKKPILTIITIILLLIFVYFLFKKQTIFTAYLYINLAVIIPLVFFSSLHETKFDLKDNYNIIVFCVSLILLVFARTNLEYFNSTNSKNQVQIYTDSGEIYNCNKSLLKIGNTETYTFLHYKKDTVNLIIRNDKIVKIKNYKKKQ